MTLPGVEQVMAALGMGHSPSDIEKGTGIDPVTIEKIRSLCADLARRTRLDVTAGTLSRPRWTEQSITVLEQLTQNPKGVGIVAADWASCVRNRTPRGTIGLFEPEAISRLNSWVEACGITLRRVAKDGMDEGFQLVQKGEPIYGGSRVLTWLLAVAWVASRLTECEHLALNC